MSLESVRIIKFPTFTDERGNLSVCERDVHVPFPIERVFWVYDTKPKVVRGNHAHKASSQVHVCFGGSAKIYLDDGMSKRVVELCDPSLGLFLPPMIWHSFELDLGACLLVITSNKYSEEDYIRDHVEFMKVVSSQYLESSSRPI